MGRETLAFDSSRRRYRAAAAHRAKVGGPYLQMTDATSNPVDTREILIKSYRIQPFWAFMHDAVAHPLLALTGCATWTVRFHEWTSVKAYGGHPPD